MFKSLIDTECFKRLALEKNNLCHAYLLYSNDRLLNDEIAELFAMSIFCKDKTPCFECDACKKMLASKNPDFIVLDKPLITVDDVSSILTDTQLKPMIYDYKVVLIKNADNINEIAQNKLLKTLEEPNESLIFIMTSTAEDKLLTTIKSRLKKICLNNYDLSIMSAELEQKGVNPKFLGKDFNLTEMVENSSNKDFLGYVNNVELLFKNLKTTKDIPSCINYLKISPNNKFVYIDLIDKLFSSILCKKTVFDDEFVVKLKQEYSPVLVVNIKEYIEDAYKKLKSNVNANYVFDSLLYAILKEKFLCK